MQYKVAKIAIPAPIFKLFDYEISGRWQDKILPGMRVRVPFGRQTKIGIVVELGTDSDIVSLKPILDVLDEEPLLSQALIKLVLWGADYYMSAPGEAFRCVLPAYFWKEAKKRRTIKAPQPPAKFHPKQISLTDAQQNAIEQIWNSIESRLENPHVAMGKKETTNTFLLHGVTGSGKTEVYLELARRLLSCQDFVESPLTLTLSPKGRGNCNDKKSILFLVPEISLTPQLLGRCIAELPEQVAVYHSGLTDRQRQEVWEGCASGRLKVVVGTRSALFLPMQNLKLIVVDEEHDSSFKQDERFRYNARDLAIVRAVHENAVVVLGSATPSLESLQRCRDDKYCYLSLPDRVGISQMPKICFVDLGCTANKDMHDTLISEELAKSLDHVLQRGEQSILFLNRRGFSPIQLCRDCGQTLQCPHCHISLTLHKGNESLKKSRLLCHYCLHEQTSSPRCTSCGSARVMWVGWGTERIEDDLKNRFPSARIARLDGDSTSKKGILEETLEKMRQRKIDILIGTQILTKGHDYDNVTFVGVLLAESSLNLPDFRSGERTFQLITQVAGRAGRGERPGHVIVQGFQPNNYIIRSAIDSDFDGFADREMAIRKQLNYPPFKRLIQIVFHGKKLQDSIDAAKKASNIIRKTGHKYCEVLGPAPCAIEKLRGQFRWQVLIKTGYYKKMREIIKAGLDVNFANSLKVGIKIDVDPMSVL